MGAEVSRPAGGALCEATELRDGLSESSVEWLTAIRDAVPEPYKVVFIDGLVPMVKVPPTADAMYRFLKEVLPKLPVGGGRAFAEGVVLEPPKPKTQKGEPWKT